MKDCFSTFSQKMIQIKGNEDVWFYVIIFLIITIIAIYLFVECDTLIEWGLHNLSNIHCDYQLTAKR